jgi:hypothetical protein
MVRAGTASAERERQIPQIQNQKLGPIKYTEDSVTCQLRTVVGADDCFY